MTPTTGPAARRPSRHVCPSSHRCAEGLIGALLEAASCTRWPAGPLLFDIDSATLRELLTPLLDAKPASELDSTDNPVGRQLFTAAPYPPAATQAGSHEPACCAAWLIAATVGARWPSGLLLLDAHPRLAHELLLAPLTAALTAACPAAPAGTTPRPANNL